MDLQASRKVNLKSCIVSQPLTCQVYFPVPHLSNASKNTIRYLLQLYTLKHSLHVLVCWHLVELVGVLGKLEQCVLQVGHANSFTTPST